MSCHFVHLLEVSKKCLWSLILNNFFHDLIHVYSPGGRGRQPPGDKILMSTERPYHFTHLLQVSKKSFWSPILYNFFHDLIHVYSPGGRGRQPPGDKILMSTERPYHFTHLLQVSKKSFWSPILYNFFHDLIHIYSPGVGGIQPLGDKVLMSTERPYHFTHLLQVSKKSFWSLILYNFFHDLIPGAGGIQPLGDKVLMSTETSCHFSHLLLVSNHRL